MHSGWSTYTLLLCTGPALECLCVLGILCVAANWQHYTYCANIFAFIQVVLTLGLKTSNVLLAIVVVFLFPDKLSEIWTPTYGTWIMSSRWCNRKVQGGHGRFLLLDNPHEGALIKVILHSPLLLPGSQYIHISLEGTPVFLYVDRPV